MHGFQDFVENTHVALQRHRHSHHPRGGSNNNNLAPLEPANPNDSYATPRADQTSPNSRPVKLPSCLIDVRFSLLPSKTNAAGIMIAMQANPNFDLPA